MSPPPPGPLNGDANAFLEKWRARWPHWHIAQVFVALEQRVIAEAWFALLAEWMEAALGSQEAAPGLAKLAWWQEELRGWSNGARRHPLGAVLQKQPLPWNVMANALPALRQREALQGHAAHALDTLLPFAQAIAQAEEALWPSTRVEPSAMAHLLLAEAALRGQLPNITNTWKTSWPTLTAAAAPRRIQAALLQQILSDAAPARAPSHWRTLWTAWKAARN